jgi:hypothetical protein
LQRSSSQLGIRGELSSSLELEKLLPVTLSSLRSISRYDRAVLSLLDEDGKNVHVYGYALEWESFLNHAIQTRNPAVSVSALFSHQRLNSSRRRRVCARLTGISVCFLSSMRSW